MVRLKIIINSVEFLEQILGGGRVSPRTKEKFENFIRDANEEALTLIYT